MAVTIKSEREIELMRQAGKYIAMAHAELEKEVKPGMSTYQIDKIGEEIIRSYGCIPTCLGYEGYPASLCISVNDEVVHGIPRKDRFVENGDIVSLDFCLSYKGYQSDCARTLAIGEISDDAKLILLKSVDESVRADISIFLQSFWADIERKELKDGISKYIQLFEEKLYG